MIKFKFYQFINHITFYFNNDISKIKILTLHFLYISSVILQNLFQNREIFFEQIFNTTTFIYYVIIFTSYIFIKNVNTYFIFSLVALLDIPVIYKEKVQELIIHFSLNEINLKTLHLLTFGFLFFTFFFILFVKKKYLKFCFSFLFIYYLINIVLIIKSKPIESKITISNKVNNINKNYYIYLFDGYPKDYILKKYSKINSQLYIDNYLKSNFFQEISGAYSNYTDTEKSILSLLSGNIQNATYPINTVKILENNIISNGENYDTFIYSIFDNMNRPNSLISVHFFPSYNNLAVRYIIPFFLSLKKERGLGNFTDYENYNIGAYNTIGRLIKNPKKHILFLHLFTPHFYPIIEGQSFENRISNANFWIKKCVDFTIKNDQDAGIIILSDHGLRNKEIPKELWNKNILYFRNLDIDTNKVNKSGLMALFSSINFNKRKN